MDRALAVFSPGLVRRDVASPRPRARRIRARRPPPTRHARQPAAGQPGDAVRRRRARLHRRLSERPPAHRRRARPASIRWQDRRLQPARDRRRDRAAAAFPALFQKMDATKLSQLADIDRRILLASIAGELAHYVEMNIFEKNPMVLRARARRERLHQARFQAARRPRARHRDHRGPGRQSHDRGEDEPRAGVAEAIRRARDPDRERVG